MINQKRIRLCITFVMNLYQILKKKNKNVRDSAF